MTMQLIQTVTVGSGGAASIEFTSIPQDGTDLIILISARASNALVTTILEMQINNDIANNYTYRDLRGNGSTASSTTLTFDRVNIQVSANSSTANTFGNASVYISNYSGINSKQISVDHVTENNATAANAYLTAARWAGTAAVNSIKLTGSLMQYSTASLYKITKGSDGTTVVS